MAIVYFNCQLPQDKYLEEHYGQDVVWRQKNGATRKELLVVNKLGVNIPQNMPVQCSLGTLEKNKKAYLFINKNAQDNRVFGVFLNSYCGFTLKDGEAVFEADSTGGYGNSQSKMGVYKVGALVAVHSYKNRGGDVFYRLTEKGWVEISDMEMFEQEIQEI